MPRNNNTPSYIAYDEYKKLPDDLKNKIRKANPHTTRCPKCRRVYLQIDPGKAIYCNKCGTLFEVNPYMGVRILSTTIDEGW